MSVSEEDLRKTGSRDSEEYGDDRTYLFRVGIGGTPKDVEERIRVANVREHARVEGEVKDDRSNGGWLPRSSYSTECAST